MFAKLISALKAVDFSGKKLALEPVKKSCSCGGNCGCGGNCSCGGNCGCGGNHNH